MPKVKKTVTLDKELVEWCEKEIKNKRFASLSHAIEYCIQKVENEAAK